MSRPLLFLLTATLLGGCMSWLSDPEPRYAREHYSWNVPVPERFTAMDLPYYGGMIEIAGPNMM